MPTANAEITRVDHHVVVFAWALTSANPDGAPIPPRYADYADRCVHIKGTFDSATVVWQGSNDGATYQSLTDPQGNAISKTAEGIEQVTEGALFQRPNSSGGGASQAVTVICVCRRGRGGKEI